MSQHPQLAHKRILIQISTPQPPLLARIRNLKRLSGMQHPPVVEDHTLARPHHPLVDILRPVDDVVELLRRGVPVPDVVLHVRYVVSGRL